LTAGICGAGASDGRVGTPWANAALNARVNVNRIGAGRRRCENIVDALELSEQEAPAALRVRERSGAETAPTTFPTQAAAGGDHAIQVFPLATAEAREPTWMNPRSSLVTVAKRMGSTTVIRDPLATRSRVPTRDLR
jgi:hypothetical protein